MKLAKTYEKRRFAYEIVSKEKNERIGKKEK
jgi:hypothetical protein